MSSEKVLIGILAGAAVGALAGILFAPAKGSRTRKRILDKGEGYADDLKEKFGELLDEVTKNITKVKEEVTEFVEKKVTAPLHAEKAEKEKNAVVV
jgi:gas vesicle protein